MDIKILIADDHAIIREGLSALIEKENGMTVVAKAENGREAVQMVLEYTPDLVVMDISMPELNGIDAASQILAARPHVKIIALSMFSDRHYVAGMLKAGVAGYLLKSNAFEELVLAVRGVMKNQGYLSQKITGIVMKDYVSQINMNNESLLSSLTLREREVLQLIAEGRTSQEIADSLFVSVKTISGNRQRLMDKLKANSVVELTKIALREGLVSLDY